MQNQDRVEDHLNDQQYCCNILVLKFSSPPKIDAISSVYCSLFPLLPNRTLSIFLQPLTSGNHVDADTLDFLAEIFIFNEEEEQWAMIRALELIQDEYVFFETSEFCQESMITLDVNGQYKHY